MIKKILFICIVILVPVQALGFDVTASVDRNQISLGQPVHLKIIMNNGEGDINIAPIKDFDVHSQGESTSITMSGSSIQKICTANYILFPKNSGQLIIPALAVKHAGQTVYTQPIIINVTKTSNKQSQSSDILFQASLQPQKPFIGQECIYTLKVMLATRVHQAQIGEPEFAGFTAQELPGRNKYDQRVAGKLFAVTEIKYLLTPIKNGQLSIGPATLNCQIPLASSNRPRSMFDNFFNDSFFSSSRLETKVFQTNPLEINVQPLPASPAGTIFSGLVGQFGISSSLSNNRLTEGDSTTLTVTISGQGNIMDAAPPKLDLPKQIKVYADSPREDIKLQAEGHKGSKNFAFALVPTAAGKLVLPAVNLTWFDPDLKQFRSQATKSLQLEVLPALNKPAMPALNQTEKTTSKPVSKQQVDFIHKDILPLNENLDCLQNRSSLPWSLFALFLISPLPFFIFCLVWAKLRNSETSQTRKIKLEIQKELQKADKQKDLHLLRNTLTKAISLKTGLSANLTEKEIIIALQKQGMNTDFCQQTVNTIQQVDNMLFGQEKNNLDEIYKNSQKIIKRLI